MFRLLFERSADAMSLFDPAQGRFVESNEAMARQVGAPSVAALSQASPIEISPERQPDGRPSVEKAAEMVQLALAQGSHRFQWMSRRFDGSELPLDIVMTAIQLQGRPMLFAVSRDISAQKQAETEILHLNASLEQRVALRTEDMKRANEQLQAEIAERRWQEESERQRRKQAQRHRDVLMELAQARKSDLEKSLATICARSAETLEVTRVSFWALEAQAAIVCRWLHVLAPGANPENLRGTRLAVADCPEYFAALSTQRPIVADDVFAHAATLGLAAYLRPRGITSMLDAPVWLRGEMVGVLCHEHTGPARKWAPEEVDFVSGLAGMVSLALEESQRAESERLLRESEALFSAAFQASPMFVTVSRMEDGRYVLINDAFLQWTGYQLEEALGKNSSELALWDDVFERTRFWDQVRKTGQVREMECRVRNRGGEARTMLLSADIIEIHSAPHVLVTALDITQRKAAEVELVKAVTRERELGLLRSKFVSVVSHEFRTPLGIIQSSAEILEEYSDRLDSAQRREHLQSIQKNTRRMARMMEEALLIGSLDAGKMEFKPATVDLGEVARELVEETLSTTEGKCPINLTLEDMLPSARSDTRILRHILSNLLTNAVKYSDSGTPVSLTIRREDHEAVCVVRDHGIGIPEADRAWIFNAFHRGANVSNIPGTGLGLVVVKRCVDLHGGKINVESPEQGGTQVTVRLPVYEPPQSDDHKKQA